MQPLNWYVRRLASMSPAEIAWRAHASLRDAADRYRFRRGLYPRPLAAGAHGVEDALPAFRLVDIPQGSWLAAGPARPERNWLAALRLRADALVAHRFSFFDLEDRLLGDPVDWNRDHASGRAAPLSFAPAIDYRDFRVTGDAKVVWEPNRHHQLVVLGRAYRATGEQRYAAAVVEQIDSWRRQNPFGFGMNWRSPLELAIRLINWTYAADLIRDSGLLAGEVGAGLQHSIRLHLWEISRKYSRTSSANNHRIGEAAGVAVAATYFSSLPGARRWREESRRILCEEIHAQTYEDGCNREQALGYHLFVLQFFLIAGIVARRAGEALPDRYWAQLEKLLGFASALAEGGEQLPMFGDADDGYVLDVGPGPLDFRGWLAVGAALFGRSDLKRQARGTAEPVAWLLGAAGMADFERVPPPPADDPLLARGFAASGHYLLQCGTQEQEDRISVLFDCGELGFGPIAAHGHADALSFTVRAFGDDVLVDTGTYDYFSFPAWRRYFRSTQAHNALVIDGLDQSTMLGPFLWGQRARARCLDWLAGPAGARTLATAEHDGYRRLPDPALHRRTLKLDPAGRTLTLRDEIAARGEHEIGLYFHLAEHCVVAEREGNAFELAVRGGRVRLRLDPRLQVDSFKACEAPIAGWVSRGYHRKAPGTTLVGQIRTTGNADLECLMEFGAPRGGRAVEGTGGRS